MSIRSEANAEIRARVYEGDYDWIKILNAMRKECTKRLVIVEEGAGKGLWRAY